MKKLVVIIISVLLIITFSTYLFVQFLSSDYNKSTDKNHLNNIVLEIKSAEKLPLKFIEAYNKTFHTTNTNGYIFRSLLEKKNLDCPCQNVARTKFYYTTSIKNNHYVISWKLEKMVTQLECLNYYVENFDFTNNNIGIKNASLYYFEKELSKLSEDELQTLCIMLINPSLYNPKLFPEKVKKKLFELNK